MIWTPENPFAQILHFGVVLLFFIHYDTVAFHALGFAWDFHTKCITFSQSSHAHQAIGWRKTKSGDSIDPEQEGRTKLLVRTMTAIFLVLTDGLKCAL